MLVIYHEVSLGLGSGHANEAGFFSKAQFQPTVSLCEKVPSLSSPEFVP